MFTDLQKAHGGHGGGGLPPNTAALMPGLHPHPAGGGVNEVRSFASYCFSDTLAPKSGNITMGGNEIYQGYTPKYIDANYNTPYDRHNRFDQIH